MTLINLYLAIGWFFLFAFIITFAVTILSLIHLAPVEEKYKNKLFRFLLLEIIFAGLFLFYRAYGSEKISYAPEKIYAFDTNGKWMSFEIFQGDILVKKFDEIPNYKNIPREVLLENNKLHFKTKEGEIYLGYIDNARQKLSN